MFRSRDPCSEDKSEYYLRVLIENSSWREWLMFYDWAVGQGRADKEGTSILRLLLLRRFCMGASVNC
jgi:hypothetical protein